MKFGFDGFEEDLKMADDEGLWDKDSHLPSRPLRVKNRMGD